MDQLVPRFIFISQGFKVCFKKYFKGFLGIHRKEGVKGLQKDTSHIDIFIYNVILLQKIKSS